MCTGMCTPPLPSLWVNAGCVFTFTETGPHTPAAASEPGLLDLQARGSLAPRGPSWASPPTCPLSDGTAFCSVDSRWFSCRGGAGGRNVTPAHTRHPAWLFSRPFHPRAVLWGRVASSCLQRLPPPPPSPPSPLPRRHSKSSLSFSSPGAPAVDSRAWPVVPSLPWLCAGSALASRTRDEAVVTSSLLPAALRAPQVWASHLHLIQCGTPAPHIPRAAVLCQAPTAAPGVQLALWSEQDDGP